MPNDSFEWRGHRFGEDETDGSWRRLSCVEDNFWCEAIWGSTNNRWRVETHWRMSGAKLSVCTIAFGPTPIAALDAAALNGAELGKIAGGE